MDNHNHQSSLAFELSWFNCHVTITNHLARYGSTRFHLMPMTNKHIGDLQRWWKKTQWCFIFISKFKHFNMFVGNGYYVTYFGMHDNFHLRPNRNQHISLGYLLIYPPQIATVMKHVSFCSKYNPVSHTKSLGESREWNMVFQGNIWYRPKAF